MPTYDFLCSVCGFEVAEWLRSKGSPHPECCGKEMERRPSKPYVHTDGRPGFAGGGWGGR